MTDNSDEQSRKHLRVVEQPPETPDSAISIGRVVLELLETRHSAEVVPIPGGGAGSKLLDGIIKLHESYVDVDRDLNIFRLQKGLFVAAHLAGTGQIILNPESKEGVLENARIFDSLRILAKVFQYRSPGHMSSINETLLKTKICPSPLWGDGMAAQVVLDNMDEAYGLLDGITRTKTVDELLIDLQEAASCYLGIGDRPDVGDQQATEAWEKKRDGIVYEAWESWDKKTHSAYN